MKLSDALNIFGIVGQNITLDMCKDAYRKACKKYHPGINPAGTEMMKALNLAWECLQKLDWNRQVNNVENVDINYGDELNKFINTIITLEGIMIEVCGAWVWLSGNTKPYKDIIKAAGASWASKKSMWYFRPKEWKKSNHSEWEMEKIRAKFGSQGVASVPITKLDR